MMLNAIVGYDPFFQEAYDVCAASLDIPCKGTRNELITRDQDGATEFTYSRFLVPYQMEFKGWTLFCDCDFLFLASARDLIKYIDDKYAVLVCKHPHYVPIADTKMEDEPQHMYPRKNWSSLILWNNKHPSNRVLTPEKVNSVPPSSLHQFMWLNDDEIGSIPLEWNTLVGYYHFEDPKALHYTEGLPLFDNYRDTRYADLWLKAYDELLLS